MRVLVIANRADPETGFVGEALVARGAVFDRAWREDVDIPLPKAGAHDLVLSLGSEWSVYEPELSAAVERESTFLRESVRANVPVLGICFGAQLLAHAFGGRVQLSPEGGEVGWHRIESDVPDVLPEGPYLQWHKDVFEVPSEAVELARSSIGPQAFRLRSALGVQFHPETTPDVAARWSAEDRQHLHELGLDEATVISESAAQARTAGSRAETIVDSFLAGMV